MLIDEFLEAWSAGDWARVAALGQGVAWPEEDEDPFVPERMEIKDPLDFARDRANWVPWPADKLVCANVGKCDQASPCAYRLLTTDDMALCEECFADFEHTRESRDFQIEVALFVYFN